MKTKLAVMIALLALVPFAVAACGDDDDDDAGTTEAATTETTDTGGDTGAGTTVSFTADPGGSLAFEEDSAAATAGTVTVELTNDSSLPHDVQIEGLDGDLGGTEEVTGGTATAEVELEPGEYTLLLGPGPPRRRHGGHPHRRVGTTRPGEPRAPAGRSRRRRPAGRGSGSRRPGSRGRRHAAAGGDRRRAGVVGSERERDLAELLEQGGHQVGLGVDRGVRVERVAARTPLPCRA